MEHLLLALLLLSQQCVNHVDDPFLPGTHLVSWLVDKQAEPPMQSPALVVLLLPPLPLLPCLAPQRRLPSFSFLKHLSAFSSSLSYEEWFMSVCDMSDVKVNPRYNASALVCLQI